MDAATRKQVQCFSLLALRLLNVTLLRLNQNLIPDEYPDYTLVPHPAARHWDDVMFGGILFNCETGCVCEISHPTGIRFAALHLRGADGFMLLGPYLPETAAIPRLTDAVRMTDPEDLNQYLQGLPVLTHEKIYGLLDTLMFELYDSHVSGRFMPLELSDEHPSPCPVFEEDALWVRAERIAARYEGEQKLLGRVMRGEHFSRDLIYPVNISRIPNKLRNGKNLLIVFNTLLRKAIEGCHIHPFYIDQISAKWAVRIENIETQNQAEQIRYEILEDYSRLVRRRSLADYTRNVRAMINYVQFHLADIHLSLQAIAEKMGANASYLSQQFNRETGKSFPEYVTEMRMAEAKSVLRSNKKMNIGQVAAAVGYADANYFTRVFRRTVGMTPSAWQREH